MQGTLDIQITVEDAKLLAESNSSAELVIIVGMNHTLKKCASRADQVAAYNDPSVPVMAELVDKIDQFLTANLPDAESDRSK